MTPPSTALSNGLTVKERACLNCSGRMSWQGVKNGLYVYFCTSCRSSFEVYEPK
jgi:hypothetical protein